MPQYTPPVRDTRFVLEQVVGLDGYSNLPGFDAASPDVVDAVLEEGGKFVAEVLFPLNLSGDQQGCTRHEDGSVRFIVPPHSPDTILGTYIAFCASDPLAISAAIAPCVRPGYIANAM